MNEWIGKQTHTHTHTQELMGLPWGIAVKNSPVKAGDTGLISGLGTFHMPWGKQVHVSLLLKPVNPRAWALQREELPQREAPELRLESSPCSLRLEKASAQQQRASTANKYINKIFLKLKN